VNVSGSSVRLSFSIESISYLVVFFYNKSADNPFSYGLSAKRKEIQDGGGGGGGGGLTNWLTHGWWRGPEVAAADTCTVHGHRHRNMARARADRR